MVGEPKVKMFYIFDKQYNILLCYNISLNNQENVMIWMSNPYMGLGVES